MADLTDGDLMRRYADGDASAFDELFRRYERRAFRYFIRRTGSGDRASDLYQELFLRLHRFRIRYDPNRPFAPWFFRLAHNVFVDEMRRPIHRREVALTADTATAPDFDPEQQAEQGERALQLLRLVPDEQADLIVATKVLGLAYAEVAARTGSSVDALKQSTSRALRHLRQASAGSAA